MKRRITTGSVRRAVTVLASAGLLAAALAVPAAATSFNPHTPSQEVDCNLVDNAIAGIPHGNGDGIVTDDEVGPGGWRFNGAGRSFVTFKHALVGDDYVVFAGRSNSGPNAGIINDYPATLNSLQSPREGALVFSGRRGEIVLSGGAQFNLPGQGDGRVRITVSDADRDGIFEGCAKTPQLTNFGFTVAEGGDFVQREYFKAYAQVDGDGTVTFYEWTEISTFKNTTSAN
jgi:hypothetical protein